MDEARATAVVELGRALRAEGYGFEAPTPETHRRARENRARRGELPSDRASVLRRLFGWSESVPEAAVPRGLRSLMLSANALAEEGGEIASRLRCSTLGDRLYFHSPFPTASRDSVFFGPDSYRFARFLAAVVQEGREVLDVGCGSGVGGIELSCALGARATLVDANPLALELALANARLNGRPDAVVAPSDWLEGAPGAPDVVVANPPYLVDAAHRRYQDGGDRRGAEASITIVRQALDKLPAGGQLALYSGACVVEGEDVLLAALVPILSDRSTEFEWNYQEIDPDVFGEELENEAYLDVDRIAAVGLWVRRRKRE